MLQELEEELNEYHGNLNEYIEGILSRPPSKPIPLVYYEQVTKLGIPLVSGGVLDQPHIWLMQYEAIRQIEEAWMMRNAAARSQSQPAL